ncbi:C-type lectin lectoxin-Thr1-like [Strongylocentrotus purpuratus]|uniref:C-type lectin domain-containing protein n=1 Tax=Strongylocentrotus purpuratus TaxID=7668 RepID=A0A7M7P3N9_STRPU|nr:C-type lectin lectoxin-Thr1-like [Strongylocentrotus purpuratus]
MLLHSYSVNGQICNTPDWLDYGDSQYLIVNHVRTWSAARIHCQDNGGDLAVIRSHEQTAFLVTYTLKSTYGYSYWIGLHDSDGDGQYTWIDDTQPQYSNWSPSQPSSSHACVRMKSSYSVVNQGKWQTSSCSNTRVHICQRPKDSRCSWHRFGQSLYRFYGEAMSNDDARAHCVSNGGDLAIIKSEEINPGFK